MSSPSMFSAIKKLRMLLTREEKFSCARIAFFAFCVSLLEMITASVIVIFAQVLNNPSVANKYFSKIGFSTAQPQVTGVLYIAVLCGLMYLIKNILASFEVFHQNFTIQHMNFNFKNKMLHKYASSDYNFYLTRNSSHSVSIIGNDSEQIFSTGLLSLATIFSEMATFFGLILMVIVVKPLLAVIIFGVGGIFAFLLNKFVFPLFYRWGQRLQYAVLYSAQNLLQFFHAFKEIVLLGKRDSFINAYHVHSRRRSQVQAIQTATSTLPRMVLEVLFVGLFVLSIIFLCLKGENSASMMGALAGYLYLGFRLMPGLNRMVSLLGMFKSAIPSIEKVYVELNLTCAADQYVDIPSFSFNKAILFQNVSFCYLNTKKNVLSNINLEIKKGECVGIIGETGSGKSTLVDILLGLLRPNSGSVLVDGLFALNSKQWHKLIGYVPQSVYLTDDTIEKNIAFGESDEEINENRLLKAIEEAQLISFIKNLPNGIKTFVGERGVRLSGGERQRISIARALYRNPEVLIFDEATSALDNETESRLMDTIHKVSKSRTVIMVAHRITTLSGCDKIIVMKKGCLDKITAYSELITPLQQTFTRLPTKLEESPEPGILFESDTILTEITKTTLLLSDPNFTVTKNKSK